MGFGDENRPKIASDKGSRTRKKLSIKQRNIGGFINDSDSINRSLGKNILALSTFVTKISKFGPENTCSTSMDSQLNLALTGYCLLIGYCM